MAYIESPTPSFLFDLDGTLIDSVYQNVISWRNALQKQDIDLSVWRIHRRIGLQEVARFNHPNVPAGHPVRPHVAYHLNRPR